MKSFFILLLTLGLLMALLSGCELFVPDQMEAPGYATGGEETGPSTAPTDAAKPEDGNYGFTVFPEGNYLTNAAFDTEEYLAEYDCDLSFLHMTELSCATEDSLYFVCTINDFKLLCYADKSTNISAPLCGKPECTHDNPNCNAYLSNNIILCLSNYNGRLYWIGEDTESSDWRVFSAAYDGTDRRMDRTLDSNFIGNNMTSWYVLFHRGCVYWSYFTDVVVDGSAKTLARVLAFPLDSDESFVILETELTGYLKILPYRDDLYIVLSGNDDGGADCDVSLFRWNIQTREADALYHESISVSTGYECYVTEDGVILRGSSPTGPAEDPWRSAEENIYKLSFESGELEYLYNFFPTRGTYTIRIVDGMVVGSGWTTDSSLILLVKDFDGNTVLDTTFEGVVWCEPRGNISCIGADETYMYFDDEWAGSVNYAAVPLDGSELKLLWSSESLTS